MPLPRLTMVRSAMKVIRDASNCGFESDSDCHFARLEEDLPPILDRRHRLRLMRHGVPGPALPRVGRRKAREAHHSCSGLSTEATLTSHDVDAVP